MDARGAQQYARWIGAFVLAPQYNLPYVIVPMFVAMASLALWLLIKGVDRARWDAMQATPATAGR